MEGEAESFERAALKAIFMNVGLDETNAENTLKNAALSARFRDIILEAKVESGCSKETGALLYMVASKIGTTTNEILSVLSSLIGDGSLSTVPQVDAALDYVKGKENVDVEKMKEACGVGVVVTKEQIEETVNSLFEKNKEAIKTERYRYNVGKLMGEVRKVHQWADGKIVREVVDKKMVEVLGPKTEEDLAPKKKKDKSKKEKKAKKVEQKTDEVEEELVSRKELIGRELISAKNSDEVMRKHLEVTGGKIVTRFPPEPNGYLHIGHAKAMNLDFGYANDMGGYTILRFDDTNPTAEKTEYIDNIIENVHWLGFKPAKITYSSDYFEDLHALAVELIKRGKAYVCEQTAEEMQKYREAKMDSPYRNRSVEDNLKLFQEMTDGLVEEGKMVLRMKGDMQNANPNMRDLVAYRIKFHPHPHAGEKWCVYPTYDYTHCLVDSLEHVTHSLCTLEFETRRESYYWLLDVLDLYKPSVWEFSRLNINYNVLSKRKLNKLVTDNYVRGWDDPRLLTLNGLRRRGYSSNAINDFCARIGVTRNANTIDMQLLEFCARSDMDQNCKRAFAVLNPLKVVLVDFDEKRTEEVTAPNHPKRPEMGSRKLTMSRVLYIDQADFRMEDSPDYYGLAPGKEVGLRYSFNIKCVDVVKDKDGEVVEVHCTHDPEKKTKTKGHLHWIAESEAGKSPARAEIRLYDRLFKSEDPSDTPDWLKDLNPDSEVVVQNAYIEPSLVGLPSGSFQFERVGYFTVDGTSDAERMVFNRTVTLRESYPKFK